MYKDFGIVSGLIVLVFPTFQLIFGVLSGVVAYLFFHAVPRGDLVLWWKWFQDLVSAHLEPYLAPATLSIDDS